MPCVIASREPSVTMRMTEKRTGHCFDYSENAAERSGMMGLFQLAKDASRDVKYGGTGVESFAGPTAQHVIDLIRLPLEGDQKQWRTFQRSLPGNNLWREWNLSL